MDAMDRRHGAVIAAWQGWVDVAPAMGMIGTLVGLVQMLGNMSDPKSIGPAMALALLTTLYGALIANVVAGPAGKASAVLLRAGRVVEGQELALERRATAKHVRDLARGPARLAVALGLTGASDGVDLLNPASPVRLEVARQPWQAHVVGPRTGVSGAGADTPWRFAADDPTVSPYRAATPRMRRKAP